MLSRNGIAAKQAQRIQPRPPSIITHCHARTHLHRERVCFVDAGPADPFETAREARVERKPAEVSTAEHVRNQEMRDLLRRVDQTVNQVEEQDVLREQNRDVELIAAVERPHHLDP